MGIFVLFATNVYFESFPALMKMAMKNMAFTDLMILNAFQKHHLHVDSKQQKEKNLLNYY